MLTPLFSLFYVTGEFHRFLHRGRAPTCFSKMGSKAGSSSSPTFSNRHGLPNRTAFSKLRKKSRSLSLITSRPASFSYSNENSTSSVKDLTQFIAISRTPRGELYKVFYGEGPPRGTCIPFVQEKRPFFVYYLLKKGTPIRGIPSKPNPLADCLTLALKCY